LLIYNIKIWMNIKKELFDLKLKKELFDLKLKKELSCNLFIIDDFYENPDDVRKFALSETYYSSANYPGQRTNLYYIEKLNNYLQNFLKYYNGHFTDPIMSSFQYNTREDKDRTKYHIDSSVWSYAAIIYLTPDAPLGAGTGLFTHESGISDLEEIQYYMDNYTNHEQIDKGINVYDDRYDNTKWTLTASVGNVYNRLVIYKSCQLHKPLDYFGYDRHDSRLMQIIFF
jgi:hypothetical protein